MTVVRENTDKNFKDLTKLQSTIAELNPGLDRFLQSKLERSPESATPVDLIRNLVLSIGDLETIREIEVKNGKIVFAKESAISPDIVSQIRAMERNISEYGQIARSKAVVLGSELVIDPVIQKWIPKTTSYEALKADIAANGVRDAIRYWVVDGQKIIIDGCDRYSICLELGIEKYPTKEEYYPDREAAINARIDAHLVGRNLTTNAINYLIGARYVRELGNSQGKVNVAVILSELYGKTDTTIRNYGNFFRAVEYICNSLSTVLAEEFKEQLFAGVIKYTLDNIRQVHKLEPKSIENLIGVALSNKEIPLLSKLELGTEVKLTPKPGNRSLDSHVEKSAKYIGLSALGKPMVEVAGDLLVVDVQEMEDRGQWSEKVRSNNQQFIERSSQKINQTTTGDTNTRTNSQKIEQLIQKLTVLVEIEPCSPQQIAQLENLLELARIRTTQAPITAHSLGEMISHQSPLEFDSGVPQGHNITSLK